MILIEIDGLWAFMIIQTEHSAINKLFSEWFNRNSKWEISSWSLDYKDQRLGLNFFSYQGFLINELKYT